MKPFIYGRPAVEGGDRGYRVFQHAGLEQDELKSLKELFSDEDPDVRRLSHGHFQPFFVWCPWQNGNWVFGKGRIETRGRLGAMYYCYLFHGVVLSPEERAGLKHNPFVLADFFDLNDERRAQLPQIPAKINEKGFWLNLRNKLQALMGGDESQRLALATLVTASLRHGENPLGYTHDGGFDGSFWGVLYALLPPSQRASTSLSSWAAFLHPLTRLRGLADGGLTQPGCVVLKSLAEKSPFMELIARFAQLEESQLVSQMERYEQTLEDLQPSGKADPGSVHSKLEGLFRAMERPSVQSIRLWPAAGRNSFPTKARHFLEVWQANGSEREVFPKLADQLTQTLLTDFQAIAPSDRGQLVPIWLEVLAQWGDALGPATQRELLVEPSLGDRLIGQLPAGRACAMLLDAGTTAEQLAQLLRSFASHPQFDLMLKTAITQLWGRVLAAARRSRPDQSTNFALLAVFHKLHPGPFLEHSSPLIFSRQLEYLYPYLQPLPFVLACLEHWAALLETPERQGAERNEWARLRLASCLKALYGPPARWPARFAQSQTFLRGNWILRYYYEGSGGPA